jgi:spore coat polysaccharide biosynthesis protein SpsF
VSIAWRDRERRVVAIVQARMGSTRLPGKALVDIAGQPMLAHVMERASRATRVDAVCVATTTSPADDAIVALADARGWPCVRGDENDVLSRYALAAQATAAEVVVRITSDCPLLDASVVDAVLEKLGATGADYASNTQPPRTFPHGVDVEAFSAEALRAADAEDARPEWREHVTPYLYRTEGRFTLTRVDSDDDFSDQRWTVDTPEDLALVRRIHAELGPDAARLGPVRQWLRAHPEVAGMNRDVKQKAVAP